MDKAGLLATAKQRKWKVYDVRTFKNGLSYCLGYPPWLESVRVVFDLSFRRQGTCWYTIPHCIAERVLNPESMILSEGKGPGRAACRWPAAKP